MRSAGMFHSARSRSNSLHSAFRSSPGRTTSAAPAAGRTASADRPCSRPWRVAGRPRPWGRSLRRSGFPSRAPAPRASRRRVALGAAGRDAPCWTENKSPQLRGLLDVAGTAWLLKWWRRRESNPRPQVLRPRFYMRSQLFNLTAGLPSGRNYRRRARLGFSGSASGGLHRELVRVGL